MLGQDSLKFLKMLHSGLKYDHVFLDYGKQNKLMKMGTFSQKIKKNKIKKTPCI